MSLFSAIADGVTSGVKTMLGIPDAPKPEHKPVQPARKSPAASTPTSYDKKPAADTSVATYADQLYRQALLEAGVTSQNRPSRTSPLPTGNTQAIPPTDGTPVPTTDSTSDYSANTGTAATTPTPQRALVTPEVRVYNSGATTTDGRAAYLGSATSLDSSGATSDARTAADNVSRGLNYYAQTFGRNGIDEAGGGVDVVLNDHSTGADGSELFHGNGGYYTTKDANGVYSEAIRWGDGISYSHKNGGTVDQLSMLNADDLTIHEMTHGVIKHETGSIGGTADESGSVNEAFADVMAASATRDWKLGESMYTADSDYKYMRNLANPTDTSAVHSLWTTKSQYDQAAVAGTVEEHYASGIISTAAARMQARIGGDAGFQAVEQLFYHTIDDHRMGDMSFAQVAQGLRTTASTLWGTNDMRSQVVNYELQVAGL
ncbi:MAG: M4 family metallopeptidase [Thermoleophilia bacterium]|nr:M4 family metallopeptidase [Thermoleophilia bacterium]